MVTMLRKMVINNLREGGEGDLERAGTLSAFPESFRACNVIKVDIVDNIDIVDIVDIIDIIDIVDIIDTIDFVDILDIIVIIADIIANNIGNANSRRPADF